MERRSFVQKAGLAGVLAAGAAPAVHAQATLRWLDDAPAVVALQARFTELHHQLNRDTARLATDAIAQVVAA